MSKRTPENETQHGKMVINLADHLTKEDYLEVKADHTNGKYDTPEEISWESGNGHVPDVTAKKGNTFYICEVETGDSIDNEHTHSQFKLFAAAAKQLKGKFVVLVPKDHKEDAQGVINTLNIKNAAIWTI